MKRVHSVGSVPGGEAPSSLSAIKRARTAEIASEPAAASGADDGDNEPVVNLVRKQNRQLAARMFQYKAEVDTLKAEVRTARLKQKQHDATLSAVHRNWQQLESDLKTSLAAVGLAQHNHNHVRDDPSARTEQSLLQNLLQAPAELLSLDITDVRGGMRVNGVQLPAHVHMEVQTPGNEKNEVPPHFHLEHMSDDEANDPGSGARKVDTALQQRCRFTTTALEQILWAMKRYLGAQSDSERMASLRDLHSDLMADKRRLGAEAATLRDQLTQAYIKCRDLSKELNTAQYQKTSIQRRLELMQADLEIGRKDGGMAVTLAAGSASPLQPLGGRASPALPTGANGSSADNQDGAAGDGRWGARPGQQNGGGSHEGDGEGSGELAELRDQLEEQRALAQDRGQEVEQLRAQNNTLEQRLLETLQNRKASDPIANHPAYLELQRRLELESRERLREKDRADALQRDMDEARAQARQLEHEHASHVRQQRERWESKLREYFQMLHQTKKALDLKSHNLKAQTARADGLDLAREQAVWYKQEYEKQCQKHSTLKQEKTLADQRLADCNKALQRARESERSIFARLQDHAPLSHGQHVQDLQRELGATKALLAEVQSELQGSKATVDMYIQEVETTSNEYDRTREDNLRLQAQLSEKDAKVQDISGRLSKTSQEVQEARHVIHTMRNTFAAGEQAAREALQRAVEQANKSASAAEKSLHDERVQAAQLADTLNVTQADKFRLTRDRDELESRCRDAEKNLRDMRKQADDFCTRAQEAEGNLSKMQELCAKFEKRSTKALARLRKMDEQRQGTEGSDEKHAQLRAEMGELQKMLRCSVCKDNRKNTVITKCFHMFCRPCIQQNLATRNRKCPACGKAFGADDVHEIWLT